MSRLTAAVSATLLLLSATAGAASARAASPAIAAAVDYGATPRRFTPGWELVLSRAGMALVYSAMAAGLAAAPT